MYVRTLSDMIWYVRTLSALSDSHDGAGEYCGNEIISWSPTWPVRQNCLLHSYYIKSLISHTADTVRCEICVWCILAKGGKKKTIVGSLHKEVWWRM